MQYNIAELIKPFFDKVYFNVVDIDKGKNTSPRYWNGSEFEYVGLNQSNCELVYIKEIGEEEAVGIDMGGCENDYNYKNTYRIVVYVNKKPCNLKLDQYRKNIIKSLSNRLIKVKRIIKNSNRLAKMEHSFDLTLMGDVIYFAIDIEVTQEDISCCPCPEEETICEPENCCLC